MTPREAIEAAELAQTETAYRNQLGREMYEAGHTDGYRAGYEAALGDREADADAWWHQHGRALVDGPTHAELEARRWGPGGREHFADPRPGDFPGRTGRTLQSQADAEPTLDAAL